MHGACRAKSVLDLGRPAYTPANMSGGDETVLPSLRIGDRHVFSYVVPDDKTVQHLYPESPDWQDMPHVFATGYLVGLIEWACLDHLKACLEPGEGSLAFSSRPAMTRQRLPA